MARIRTIKPEFPQSESMGRVSREARLLFILLWTLCDDAGRSRGDARLLKGLLYPYDEVKFSQIEGWLAELEGEGCLFQYTREGSRYLAIRNWLTHQKIDRPSKSKFPDPPETLEKAREDSRNPLEGSSEDQGSRTKDQGPRTEDRGGARARPASRATRRVPDDWSPTPEQVAAIAAECPNVDVDAATRAFRDHEFKVARSDWAGTWRNWIRREQRDAPRTPTQTPRRLTRYEQVTAGLALGDDEEDAA